MCFLLRCRCRVRCKHLPASSLSGTCAVPLFLSHNMRSFAFAATLLASSLLTAAKPTRRYIPNQGGSSELAVYWVGRILKRKRYTDLRRVEVPTKSHWQTSVTTTLSISFPSASSINSLGKMVPLAYPEPTLAMLAGPPNTMLISKDTRHRFLARAPTLSVTLRTASRRERKCSFRSEVTPQETSLLPKMLQRPLPTSSGRFSGPNPQALPVLVHLVIMLSTAST